MGDFILDENGMIVESPEARARREKGNANNPKPKLLILGLDEEIDVSAKPAAPAKKEPEFDGTIPERPKDPNAPRPKIVWDGADEMEAKKEEKPKTPRRRPGTGRMYQTEDGFFIFEQTPGEAEAYKKKQKEKKKKEEAEKRAAARKEKEKKKRAKEMDRKNKKNGTYAGPGYHYEMREMRIYDDETRMVKVKVPNEEPEIAY